MKRIGYSLLVCALICLLTLSVGCGTNSTTKNNDHSQSSQAESQTSSQSETAPSQLTSEQYGEYGEFAYPGAHFNGASDFLTTDSFDKVVSYFHDKFPSATYHVENDVGVFEDISVNGQDYHLYIRDGNKPESGVEAGHTLIDIRTE